MRPHAGACAAVGNLMLVNGAHPWDGSLSPAALTPVGGEGVLLERRAAALLERLMADIHGWREIEAVSGWRSRLQQRALWEDSLAENGEAFTRSYVAAPGCSEHETGLAIDLGLRGSSPDRIRPDFPYSGICQTFRSNAARYGFIQRYPSGKEHITGIAHEPWHFRYVGVPHAELMTAMGLTLEEYLERLRRYPAGEPPLTCRSGRMEFCISYLPAGARPARLPETGGFLSGDNAGGVILTTWRGMED